jgi:hypothetical protein
MPHAPNNNLKAKVWDLGPQRPQQPIAPVMPERTAKMTDADFAILEIEYEDGLEDYKKALRAYSAARKEYDRWREQVGGPMVLDMWSVDSKDATARDPNRYMLELPKGMKPGKAHMEQLERERAREEELAAAADRDPQFGTKAQGVAA